MEWMDILRAGASLAFVVGLIIIGAAAAKHWGLATMQRATRRLAVRESLTLDGRHRLLIVARDGMEHLIVLGPNGAQAIETGFTIPPVFAARPAGQPNLTIVEPRP